MMKTFAVIGLGRFGLAIATRLYQLGNDVLAIDEDETLIRQIAEQVTYAVAGDAQQLDTLRNLGVANYDAAIVAVGSDLAASILVTMNCKELGVKNVICKASSERHQAALLKVGADRVIIPEKTIAVKLAENLSSGNVLDYITLSEDHSIAEAGVPKSWIGKGIAQLGVRAQYGVELLAVRRGSDMIITPGADFVFAPNDVVLALGRNEALDALRLL